MKDWLIRSFKEVAQFPPKINLDKGVSYSFIPMEAIDGETKYVYPNQEKIWRGSGGAKFQNGDTLFARITPCLQNGKIAQVKNLINGCGFGSTEYFIFRGIEGISDTDFIYYLSTTVGFRQNAIGSMVGASGRQRADASFVSQYQVILPPLPTQIKIAKILSAYDDLIDNNLKRIKLLEEIAQNTYEEWFVRFRFPNNDKTEIDAEIGLPVGWSRKKIGSLLAKVPTTKKIQSKDYQVSGAIPVIDQSRSFIAGYTDDRNALLKVIRPLIVFGDHTRILKFINFDFARGADGTQILLSKELKMPQHLLYGSLMNVDLSDYHYARHFKFLKEIEIVIPSLDVAEAYEATVEKIYSLVKIIGDKNQLLKEARDILLPRLMTGVIDIDTFMKDAV